MSEIWEYQVRVYLSEQWAASARSNPPTALIKPITDILDRYSAQLKCQFDSFAEFMAEAETLGEISPLYKWTKATLADPEKVAKHRKAFAVTVAGKTVYAKDLADRLETELTRLVDGDNVTAVSKQDTNPNRNMPVPDEYKT